MGLDGGYENAELRVAAATIEAAVLDQARFGFDRAHPKRSARRVLTLAQILVALLLISALAVAIRVAPAASFTALHALLYVLFLATILWRLLAAAHLRPIRGTLARPLGAWPAYTILCPLYREANVTPDLVAALARLDYPL